MSLLSFIFEEKDRRIAEFHEARRLNLFYKSLRVKNPRPKYIFHGVMDEHALRMGNRKTKALFPPLSSGDRKGIKIPGLRTSYIPIRGASPAIYYVKNAGDDAKDGLTDANAWQTLSKALTGPYNAGDIIQFNRGDTWTEATRWVPPSSGASDNHIIFRDYGSGDLPHFKFTGADWSYLFITGDSYLSFENLDFDGNATVTCGYICALNNGTYLDFTGCKFHNTGTDGVILRGAANAGDLSYVTYTNCEAYDSGGAAVQGEGFYFEPLHATNTVSYVTVEYCTFYNVMEGVHWDSDAGHSISTYGILRYNEFYDIDNPLDAGMIAGFSGRVSDSEFAYNYIHDCTTNEHYCVFQNVPGVGSQTNIFHHNIIDTCKIQNSDGAALFRVFNQPGGIQFLHNAAYNVYSVGANRNGIVLAGTTDYVIAKNNILHDMVNHVRNPAGGANNDFDYNCRYSGTQGDLQGGNDVTSDPQWADPANADFHLKSNSPCIDAGEDLDFELDYDGQLYRSGYERDMGPLQTLKGGSRGV